MRRRKGAERSKVVYVDGYQSVERVGTYVKIDYYTLARPPGGAVEQRVHAVTLVMPFTMLRPDGKIVEWLRGQDEPLNS